VAAGGGAAAAGPLRVVLTGGPCGGKSTVLHTLAAGLRGVDRVGAVVQCPEAATFLVEQAGVDRVGLIGTAAGRFAFNFHYARMQLAHEEELGALATATAAGAANSAAGGRAVLLCDRGMVDSKCYMPAEAWGRLLAALGQTDAGLCEDRYDLVLHLVTAADGAEDAYRTAGNAARTETPAEARDLDRRMLAVWARHPRRVVIGNGAPGGLAAKTAAALAAVRALLV
jgi:hypothetical protein